MKNITTLLISGLLISTLCFAEEAKTVSLTNKVINKLSSLEKKTAPTMPVATKVPTPVAAKPTGLSKLLGNKTVATKPETPSKPVDLPSVDEADQKAEGTTEHVRGSVSGKSNFGIAVVTSSDPIKGDAETWMNFNKSTKLKKYKKYSDIEVGDKVELTYKEIATKDKLGIKIGHKWILNEVSFLQKKPKEEPSTELPSTEDAELNAVPESPVVKL